MFLITQSVKFPVLGSQATDKPYCGGTLLFVSNKAFSFLSTIPIVQPILVFLQKLSQLVSTFENSHRNFTVDDDITDFYGIH